MTTEQIQIMDEIARLIKLHAETRTVSVLAKEINIDIRTITTTLRGRIRPYPAEYIQKFNEYFGKNYDLELFPKRQRAERKNNYPDWVSAVSPEIRGYVQQEYWVNIENARRMAEECKTREDIKRLRNELYFRESRSAFGSSLADV